MLDNFSSKDLIPNDLRMSQPKDITSASCSGLALFVHQSGIYVLTFDVSPETVSSSGTREIFIRQTIRFKSSMAAALRAVPPWLQRH